MAKQSDVTGNLHKIGSHIAESAKKDNHNDASALDPAVQANEIQESSVPEKNAVRKLNAETEAALRKRHEEFIRLKKDLSMRVTEAAASVSAENVRLRNKTEAYAAAEIRLTELLKIVENTYEPDSSRPDYQGTLAEECKTLENTRLELIRTTARLDRNDTSQSANSGKSAPHDMPLILNILDSMSFMQIFRIGAFLFLPVAGAILLTGIIVAIAVVAAMKL